MTRKSILSGKSEVTYRDTADLKMFVDIKEEESQFVE